MNASVYAVVPGSLIVLHGEGFEDDDLREQLLTELVKAAGHDRFVILSIPDGDTASVIGPAELRARLAEALGADAPNPDPPPEEPPTADPLGEDGPESGPLGPDGGVPAPVEGPPAAPAEAASAEPSLDAAEELMERGLVP